MSFTIDFEVKGATEAAAYVRGVGNKLPRQIRVGMSLSIELLKTNIMPITPVGYPGSPNKLIDNYADRREGDAEDELVGIFYSMAPGEKVGAIEMGRSSGKMPPIQALLPWVQWKFGDPSAVYAVARNIADRNVPGVFMFREAANKSRDDIGSLFDVAVGRAMS